MLRSPARRMHGRDVQPLLLDQDFKLPKLFVCGQVVFASSMIFPPTKLSVERTFSL